MCQPERLTLTLILTLTQILTLNLILIMIFNDCSTVQFIRLQSSLKAFVFYGNPLP